MCNRHVVLWATSIAGAVCILLGALALTLIPKIVEHSVEDRQFLGYTTDSNGTEQYNEVTEKWIHPPYHMQLQVWIYNVVNEADILKGAKPQVREIGPFTFRESMEKTVHNFVDNGTRVFYRNTRRYFFNRTASCAECSLDKRVTIANVLFQKLVDIALMGTAQKLAVEAVLVAAQRETPFLTITAGEALFQGYKDPLLETLCDHAILSSICKSLQLPERIGFFYGQNNTDDGLYEIDTGLTDRQKLAKVYSWNNKTILPESWWDNKQARMINGTDGQLFPPLLRTGASLDLFAAQACRSVVLEYKGQNEVEGVPAYRYTVPNELYDPSRPENLGFCNKNNTPTFFENTTIQSAGCLPAGLLDVSRCQPGQPRVYISQAHFYSSPEEVRNAVDGICEPSDEHDSTIVYIEGITGAVVRAVRRAQINIGMRKGNLNVLNKTRNVIVPVLWLNETAHFDEETRDEMKNQLWSVKHWAFASGLALLFVGIALWLAFIGVYLVPTFCQNPSEEEQLLVDDSAPGDVVVDAAD